MQIPEKTSSRKKFLRWGAVMLGSATIFRFLNRPKAKKVQTVKMLTAEGRLVEVNQEALGAKTTSKKASNKDIYNWMNNPSK